MQRVTQTGQPYRRTPLLHQSSSNDADSRGMEIRNSKSEHIDGGRRDILGLGLAGAAAIVAVPALSACAQAEQAMMGRQMAQASAASNAPAASGAIADAVIGQEYGRTPYSGMAEKLYQQADGGRRALDTSEYYAISQGYMREHVCMGQCNLYIQVLKDPMLRQAMEMYRHDVCEPNLAEMKNLLQTYGYKLPATYNAVSDAKSIDQLGRLNTDAIDDRMILVGHIFSVEGFMNRWNQGSALSHKADIRDAFVRNWHRANRWHLASLAMAEKMKFIEPQPQVRV